MAISCIFITFAAIMKNICYKKVIMKQKLLLMITLLSVFVGGAKAQEPAITLTAPAVERTITIGLNAAGKVQIDWGNGEKVEQEAAGAYDGWDNGLEFTGTPSGEVKIYAEGISYLQAFTKYAEGADVITDGITAIDLSKAATITELDLHQNNLATVDLSKLTALTTLNIGVNDFTTIDLSANTELTSLEISDGKNKGVLASIDLSKNTKLTKIVLSGNKLTSLDLTNNPVAKTITVLNNQLTSVTFGENTTSKHTINLGGNKLTSLDLTQFTTFDGMYLRVRDNELSEIKLPGKIKQLWADGNSFTMAQLYALKSQAGTLTFTSVFTKPQAQAPYAIAEKMEIGASVDLSSQAMLGETATEFVWKNKDDILTEGTDYTVENGVFTFLTAQDSLYCEMTNAELAGLNYHTTATQVVAPKELPLAVTFTAGAVERSVTVGLSEAGKVQIDWGNGEKVEKEAAGAYDGWDNGLEFTGTPSGEVKIYGENISYLQSFTKMVDGKVENGITAIDLSKATTMTELDLHQNNLTALDLSKLAALDKLTIGVNNFESIDLSANTELTTFDANCTADGNLTSLDLSKNTKLTTLKANNNKIQTIDLSKNLSLKNVYLLGNGLTAVDFGENTTAKIYISLNNNKLETLDVTALTGLSAGTLLLLNNNLTEVKLPETVKTLNVTGNKFTLASLYTLVSGSEITGLTAASMQDMFIADAINESIDLSAQATLGEKASTIKWFLKNGTELVEGTDYTVENGVYTFIKEQADSVYATLLNAEALPKLTTAIKTTLAKVTPVVVDGINTVATGRKTGVVYNLKGQRVAAPRKGLFIMDGKLMRK